MVDGAFDPLHSGHVAYFREAAALGLPVLCNVSSDEYVAAKHRPLLTQQERIVVIDAFRDIDFVHASPSTTEEILRLLLPRYYVKGADWEGRLPTEQVDICATHAIDIVFVDTVLGSSTAILERYLGA